MKRRKKGTCGVCERLVELNSSGNLRNHSGESLLSFCRGGLMAPLEVSSTTLEVRMKTLEDSLATEGNHARRRAIGEELDRCEEKLQAWAPGEIA